MLDLIQNAFMCIIDFANSHRTCTHKCILLNSFYIRFEFVKPCFGRIVIPKTPANHKWNGDKVKSLTQQGQDLYIRALAPLSIKDDDDKVKIILLL